MSQSHDTPVFQSVLPDLEELLKQAKISHLNHQECLQAFLNYIDRHDKCRDEWLHKEKELLEQLKNISKEKEKMEKRFKIEMDNLEKKLRVAQRLIDCEKSHRTRIEEEKINIEYQLQEIRNLLQDNRNKLHDETREKLQYLSSMDQRLSTINESIYQDQTGSCLSDLSFSRSEDDIIDVDSIRFLRKQRRSRGVATVSDEVVGISNKRRRSAVNTVRSDIVRAGPGECLVATTRVDLGNRGEPVASSVIETFPSTSSVVPPLQPAKPSAPQLSTDSESDDIRNGNLPGIDRTPSNTALRSPASSGFFPFGMNMINTRTHSLVSKTVIKSESCNLCGKRFKFGRVSLRCVDCKTACHVECKDKLKPPCIPPGSGTPNSKDMFGTIADYAPPTAPMIPAIVVHCVNEIEERGLTETGLYRVPGSDVEVKALRDRFLKGKGVPSLSLVSDIHVITGCLKSFLRCLKEPVATYTQRPNFVYAIQNHRDDEARRAALYQNFTELPQANRDTLAFLILHLQRVAEVPECRMPIKSLAKIMGPTVIGYSQPDLDKIKMDMFLESQQSVEVMEELLSIPSEYWKNFLVHSTPSMPCTPSTTSLRDQRGFFESPSPGWYTVRKKKK